MEENKMKLRPEDLIMMEDPDNRAEIQLLYDTAVKDNKKIVKFNNIEYTIDYLGRLIDKVQNE